jgi:hypothetical protein
MKKLLILLLSFAIAPVSNAGLIDVVTNGGVDLNENGIVDPFDIVLIKIEVAAGHTTTFYDLGLNVTGPGRLIGYDPGSGITGPGPSGTLGNHADDDMGGNMWVYSGISDQHTIARMHDVSFTPISGDLVWALAVFCEDPGEIYLDLTLAGNSYVDGIRLTADQLGDRSIQVVPEPMTIALFGLGVLMLKRKR